MELITSLIFLSVLVIPALIFAGKELIEKLFFDEANALFDKHSRVKDSHDTYAGQEASKVYDGMITVEIPVQEPQVVAYEAPPHHEIEIIPTPARISNA